MSVIRAVPFGRHAAAEALVIGRLLAPTWNDDEGAAHAIFARRGLGWRPAPAGADRQSAAG
jgi:hypothetical protein